MSIDRQTPWKRIFAEGFVIVFSILLAFWIDASWENHVEERREHEHLVAMRAEFETSQVGLQEVLSSIQHHAANVETLIEMLKAAGDQPVLVQGPLLGSAITWRTSDVSMSTLNALMASGDLNLLRNPELRASLAGLPAFLLDVTEDEIIAKEFAEYQMSVVLAREGLAEVAYAFRGSVRDAEYGITTLTAPSEAIVVPSAELIGLLTTRRVHFWYSERGLPDIHEYLQVLIDQIDTELATKS